MGTGYVDSGSNPTGPGTDVAVRATGAALRARGRDLTAWAGRRTSGEQFSQDDLDLMTRGRRPNTTAALRRQWMRLLRWQAATGHELVPMPVETCVQWIRANWSMTGRYGRPVSPETVKLSLWAITKAHRVARRPDGTRGYQTPVDAEEVRLAMAGYTDDYLAAGHRPDAATPITPAELRALIAACDVRAPDGLRDAFAFALCYDMGARAGELVAARFEDVETHIDTDLPDRIGRPADLVLAGRDHLIVHVPESKTDHEGHGDEVFIYAHPAAAADTCPVRLFLAWSQLLRDQGQRCAGPLLRRVAFGNRPPADGRPRSGKVTGDPFEYKNLVTAYGRAVDRAGLDQPDGRRRHFALHGLRAGSAEAAAERGADTPELNRHYRWSQRGTTAQRYAARGRKRRQNPARRIWGDESGDRAQASTADGAGLS